MMRFLLVFLLLVSCDSPSPAFHGVDATRIEIEGSRFVVRWFGARAEVLRLNAEWAPQIDEIARKAELAVETVSGCQAERIFGDVAKLSALLDCAAVPDPDHVAEWRRLPRGHGRGGLRRATGPPLACDTAKADDMMLRLECWRM